MRETLSRNCRKLKIPIKRTDVPGRELFESGHFPSLPPGTDAPDWGMSLCAAGSMRFRWNEQNENRTAFLSQLSAGGYETVPIELIHSHQVYAVSSPADTSGKLGDGIITHNRTLIPVVTVADCMPVFLYDPVSRVFGVLHSGWKGTGIAVDAIRLASSLYGSQARDFRVVMGPHIHRCCYRIDRERAAYFANQFTPACVQETEGGFCLSLADANRAALLKAGVLQEHITISDECTCCTKLPDGSFKFGSFRREAVGQEVAAGRALVTKQDAASGQEPAARQEPAAGPQTDGGGRTCGGMPSAAFTVQAAWVKWPVCGVNDTETAPAGREIER